MNQITRIANSAETAVPAALRPSAIRRRDGLVEEKPAVELLWVLGILLAVYGFLAVCSLHETDTFFAWAGPACLGIACLVTVCRMLLHSPMDIWTPLPWCLFASALYYGLGPMSIVLGNSDTKYRLNQLIILDPLLTWRTNVLNVSGLLLVTGSYVIARRYFEIPLAFVATRKSLAESLAAAKVAAVLFVGIGMTLKLFIALPYEFGFTNFLLPGVVLGLCSLTNLGVLVLGYVSVIRGGVWQRVFVAFTAVEFLLAILRFSKAEVLLVVMMAALGRYLATQRFRTLGGGVVVCLVLFVTACPLVAWCRAEATRRVGNIQQVALGERFDILLLWFSESAETSELSADGDAQEWWLRLNYANAQAIVMEEYDIGHPGRSFGFAVYALVPRMLWPNKPDMTEVGVDLNEMVAGHRHSSMSIGVMGEAYWNGGWGMVTAVSVFLGVVFAWLKQTATRQMGLNQWLYLPCIFIGIRMGYRIDGWFVADYFGTLVIYGFYSLVVYAIYSPLVGYALVDSGRRPSLVTSE